MAYTEPYPVVTSWPSTDGYSIGTKLCFHYTLTYEQVAKLASDADRINSNSTVNNLSEIAVPSLLASIAAKVVGATVGGVATATSLFITWCKWKNQPYIEECIVIGNIWKKIANYMYAGNYKRVTISQLIELDAIYGIDIFPEGFPVWRYAAYPRVPDISYYYRQ